MNLGELAAVRFSSCSGCAHVYIRQRDAFRRLTAEVPNGLAHDRIALELNLFSVAQD